MAIKQIVTILLLLTFLTAMFAPVGIAVFRSTQFCGDASTLNITSRANTTIRTTFWLNANKSSIKCAWGCVQGECLNGTDLGVNAWLTLFVYLLPTIACILLAYLLDDRYQFTKNALLGMGILIGIIGIIVTMGVYPVADGTMSAIVPSLFSGITAGSGVIVLLVGLMILVIFTVRKIDLGKIERGEA